MLLQSSVYDKTSRQMFLEPDFVNIYTFFFLFHSSIYNKEVETSVGYKQETSLEPAYENQYSQA